MYVIHKVKNSQLKIQQKDSAFCLGAREGHSNQVLKHLFNIFFSHFDLSYQHTEKHVHLYCYFTTSPLSVLKQLENKVSHLLNELQLMQDISICFLYQGMAEQKWVNCQYFYCQLKFLSTHIVLLFQCFLDYHQ